MEDLTLEKALERYDLNIIDSGAFSGTNRIIRKCSPNRFYRIVDDHDLIIKEIVRQEKLERILTGRDYVCTTDEIRKELLVYSGIIEHQIRYKSKRIREKIRYYKKKQKQNLIRELRPKMLNFSRVSNLILSNIKRLEILSYSETPLISKLGVSKGDRSLVQASLYYKQEGAKTSIYTRDSDIGRAMLTYKISNGIDYEFLPEIYWVYDNDKVRKIDISHLKKL